MWVHRGGDVAISYKTADASKGRIPGALWASEDDRWDSKGVNRQEGTQTLKAEHRRHGYPPNRGPSNLTCAVGSKSP